MARKMAMRFWMGGWVEAKFSLCSLSLGLLMHMAAVIFPGSKRVLSPDIFSKALAKLMGSRVKLTEIASAKYSLFRDKEK